MQLNDKPGQEEVELVRKFGDETIRVSFSISDLNALSAEESMDDGLFEDPGEDAADLQSGGAQSAAAKERGDVATADDEFSDDEEEVPSYPARINVTIEKVTPIQHRINPQNLTR